MLEKKIEANICTYAKKHGLFQIKLTSPSRIGLPDRMFISKDGEVFFIEFKAKGKKPTKLQEYTINKLRSYNVYCYVVDNIEYGRSIIDNYVKTADTT